jgi:hypothetical protein
MDLPLSPYQLKAVGLSAEKRLGVAALTLFPACFCIELSDLEGICVGASDGLAALHLALPEPEFVYAQF